MTPEDREVLEELRRIQATNGQTLSELRRMQAGGANNHNIMMQSPDSGERAAHKAEKVAVGLACLLLGLLFGGWSMVSDLKNDITELRRQQQSDGDYRNLLYRNYPELRPDVLKKREAEKN